MRSFQLLLVDSQWDALYLYTSQDLLLWRSGCLSAPVKGSLRAVGFAVTPAGLLKGLGSPGQ